MHWVVKLIATAIAVHVAFIISMLLMIAANHMINGEDLIIVVVGTMTYTACFVMDGLAAFGIFKLWSRC